MCISWLDLAMVTVVPLVHLLPGPAGQEPRVQWYVIFLVSVTPFAYMERNVGNMMMMMLMMMTTTTITTTTPTTTSIIEKQNIRVLWSC